MTTPTTETAACTLLGRAKPVIGMVHFPPLPGSPFDRGLSRQALLDAARRDLEILVTEGFDAVAISNEGDRPYVAEVSRETLAMFTALVARLTEDLPLPFGCGVLQDPRAGLAVARAVGATFVRVSYGVTVGTFGIVAVSSGEILRYRRQIGADQVQLFVNLSPHYASSLDTRPLAEVARACRDLAAPDAIQVFGAGAGSLPALDVVRQVKAAVPDVPVVVASGATEETLPEVLAAGDGVIVGTGLKKHGIIWNPIDRDRARAFMRRVRDLRGA